MTKNDIKRKMIIEGSSFAEAFPFEKSGQECTIFLKEAHGNASLARCIFTGCDWENPDIQDIMDCTDDREAIKDFGGTWEDIEAGRTADISGYENR